MGTRRRIGEWRKERWLQMKQEHRDKQMNMGTWRRIREWRKERRQQRKQAQGEKTTDERIGERARQSWSHQTRHITRITCPSLVEHRFGRVLLLRHGHGTGWAYKADWTKVATRKRNSRRGGRIHLHTHCTWKTHDPGRNRNLEQENRDSIPCLFPPWRCWLSVVGLLVDGCWMLVDVCRTTPDTTHMTHSTRHITHDKQESVTDNHQPITIMIKDEREGMKGMRAKRKQTRRTRGRRIGERMKEERRKGRWKERGGIVMRKENREER